MIKKILIQNYRSCLDTEIEFHPNLSVLIGPNSSGKTNILNALLLLRKLSEEDRFPNIDEKATGQCNLKVWFDIGGKNVILTAVIDIFTDDNNSDIVVSSKQRWYAKDFTGNAKRIDVPLWMVNEFSWSEKRDHFLHFSRRKRIFFGKKVKFEMPDSAIEPLNKIATDLSEIRYYSASQFTNPSTCPVSFEIEKEGKRKRGIGLKGHAKFLFDLYNSAKSTDKASYIQFLDIIGKKGINLIDGLRFKEIATSSVDYSVRSGGSVIQKKREKILVIPQFNVGTNELSTNQLSEGTFKTITLLFYLITEASKVLLVEEPEVCVHHGLLSSIIELVKTYSRDKQIVLSTHSDFVLDKVQPENVYKVTNSPLKGTKVSHIPKSMSRLELAALREYLEAEGNLGEYWRHGGLE